MISYMIINLQNLKESEMLQSRLGNLATIEPYIGKFYSTEFVRKKILRQTDSEIDRN